MIVWHLSYLPDFASANVLLFLRANSGLVDLLLSQNSFKTSLKGIIRTIAKDKFVNSIQYYSRQKAAKSASTSAMTRPKYNLK
jgi:hypothetical protein